MWLIPGREEVMRQDAESPPITRHEDEVAVVPERMVLDYKKSRSRGGGRWWLGACR